ncbi:selenocysteine-specific translation elongation factor [Aminomonas paucivorans]|uniref:selenocysteine-specific translation elongation factor n=1 Tax=Aminomonas paucivorans TaxID=81412 RepID=UPI0033215970
MNAPGEFPFVIGTAGHIDHGKTALVKALTGVDCDRLREEKKRGITIELGFAPLILPDGRVVSLVDVPGHERFIRQMVAGAAGIDAALLVVASDEGIMPQTREHLDILELLGVRDGLVVLTKCDLVEEDFLAMVEEDVEACVRGTFLEGRPVVPVSAFTGEGLEVLREEVARLVERGAPRSRKGAFFLPIDRAFPISGFGTVVTGTAYRGSLKEGEDVEILPRGGRSKVRSLQVHGDRVPEATAGQRVAVNIPSVSVDSLERGDVLAVSGRYRETSCLEVRLRLLPGAPEPVRHWQRLRVHLGTSDVVARVGFLDRLRLNPGEEVCAQLVAEEPVAAVRGEHFVIRFYSPLQTIGGGEVLFAYGEKPRGARSREERRRFLASLCEAKNDGDRVEAYLDLAGCLPFTRLEQDLQCLSGDLMPLLREQQATRGWAVLSGADPLVLSQRRHRAAKEELIRRLEVFHEEHPERKGLPVEEGVGALLRGEQKAYRAWVESLHAQGALVLEEGRMRLPGFNPAREGVQETVSRLLEYAQSRGFQLPELAEAQEALALDASQFRRVLQVAKESGEGHILAGTFFLSREVERRFWSLLGGIDGEITVATVRDASGTSRKYSLPLLEHFDSLGVTRRVQDRRVLLKRPPTQDNP